MQTMCLRVHQLTFYFGRLRVAAVGSKACYFPWQFPGQGLEAAQAAGMEGSRQDGAGKEEPASSRAPLQGERESPAVGQRDWEMKDPGEIVPTPGSAEKV